MVLEKTPESPLDSKEIKPVSRKGDQPWILIGRTDAEAATPVFWSSNENSRLIGKDPDAGKDWRQKEEEDVRGWDAWMASLMQWARTWASFGRWWGTERPGMLQSMGLQKNWTQLSDWTTTLFYTSERKLEGPKFLRLWCVSPGSRQFSGVRVPWWRGWEDDRGRGGAGDTGRKPARWHLSRTDLPSPPLSWNILKIFILFSSFVEVMCIFLLSK